MAIDIFNEEVCNWDIWEVYCNLHVISGKFNLRFYELCHEMAREKNWVIMGLNKFCSWDIYSLEGLFQGIMFWENEMQIRIKSFMRASCLVVSDSLRSHGLQPAKLVCPWNSPGKNTEVVSGSLLQGIFPDQGSNPGLLHCRRILYLPSHQGSPKSFIVGP